MIPNLPRSQEVPPLAKAIAAKFGALPQVVAVAFAGSRTVGVSNETSDYDLFVYVHEDIPVEEREAIAKEFAERIEIDNQFWEPGDEWIHLVQPVAIPVVPLTKTLFLLLSTRQYA